MLKELMKKGQELMKKGQVSRLHRACDCQEGKKKKGEGK